WLAPGRAGSQRRKSVPVPSRALLPASRSLIRYAYQTRRYSTRGVYLPRNFSIRGDRNDPRGFLVSLRPVSRCAICKNISVVRCVSEISAIIWPLLAAEPNICGSKGIETIGWLSIALANSTALISGRFGTPTWFRQYSGGRSLGREALSRSKMFLVLRRLARSGE